MALKYRIEEIESGTGLTENSSDKFELPEHGALSALYIRITDDEESAQTGVDNWRITDNISRIEVIANGHQTITSLSARQLQALYFYETGMNPYACHRSYATNTQWVDLILPFGRKVFDGEYGLNLDDYRSLELKVTNTFASTYWQAKAAIDVNAVFLGEGNGPRFRGHFKKAIWESYTPAQNGWKYFDLPERNLLRAAMVQADPAVSGNKYDTYYYNCMYDIEFMTRTGTNRVLDTRASKLTAMQALTHGMPMEDGRLYSTTNYKRSGIGRTSSRVFGSSTNTGAVDANSWSTDDGTENDIRIYTQGGDLGAWYLARGEGIENTLYIPFSVPKDEPVNYLDTVSEATVELNIHTRDSSSADNGTTYIVLDELITG